MDFLQDFANSTQLPIISALILGLMTAISPCPLATNITAIGFISKDLQNRRKIFVSGLMYTLGRVVSYTVLGVILIALLNEGGSVFKIQKTLSQYGGYFLGPILILIGIFMFDIVKINFSLFKNQSDKLEARAQKGGYWSSFVIGLIFALAFCPYSGILYFGGLIPLSVASTGGHFLPVIFAIATGLPVIIVAWLLAFSISSLGSFYNKMKIFEYWFRRVVGVVFILAGLYYVYTFYL